MTSEVQAHGNGKSLEECVRILTREGNTGGGVSGDGGGVSGDGGSVSGDGGCAGEDEGGAGEEGGARAERRAHCLNVLRALYRHSALQQYVAPHVGTGLQLALRGFDSHTWMVRYHFLYNNSKEPFIHYIRGRGVL